MVLNYSEEVGYIRLLVRMIINYNKFNSDRTE